MGKIICSNCGSLMSTDYLMSCHSCGAVLCESCAAENGLTCNGCYSGLRYYS